MLTNNSQLLVVSYKKRKIKMKINKGRLLLLLSLISVNSYADQYVIITPSNGVKGYEIDGMDLVLDRTSFNANDSITATWNVLGRPSSISLSGYGPLSTNSGSVTYKPGVVNEITLTAMANDVSKIKSIPVTVQVYSVGSIAFTASKTTFFVSDTITVNWSIDGQPEKLNISGYGDVTPTSAGSITFAPGNVSSITLTATANGVSKTSIIPVAVSVPPLAGTLDSGYNCKSILAAKPASANGDYTITGSGSSVVAYCDMSGGGWMLLSDFGSNIPHPHALKGVGINDSNGLVANGYTYLLTNINGTSYHVDPNYMQFYNSGSAIGWIETTLPNYASEVKTQVSSQWYSNGLTETVTINGTVIGRINPYQVETDIKATYAANSKLRIVENGIYWVNAIWVK